MRYTFRATVDFTVSADNEEEARYAVEEMAYLAPHNCLKEVELIGAQCFGGVTER